MATFTVTLQGTTPTAIGGTDKIKFAGPTGFDDPILVGEYNDTTHGANSGNAEISGGNSPNNVKFISQAGGTAGDSQGDWGSGTEDLDQITNAEATLKLNFSDALSVNVSNWNFFVYDGTNEANGPANLDIRAAEVGDPNWTQCEGSGSALSLSDSVAAATSHDRYVPISISPTVFDTSYTFEMKFSLTYQ